MRVVIASGSPVCYNAGLADALKRRDLFICADYGIRRAIEVGAMPDIIIGDFDSALEADLEALAAGGAEVKRFPKNKDATDLELCVKEAAERGATECEIYGATGGRADHALGNIHALLMAERLGVRAAIRDGHTSVFALIGGCERAIDADTGDIISLIPLTERACGVTTAGLSYPLNNETLYAGYSRGISNTAASMPCAVSLVSGELAVWRVGA